MRAAHATAMMLLVAVLGTTWVAGFRYPNSRATYKPWPVHLARIEERCDDLPRDASVAQISCPAARAGDPDGTEPGLAAPH